MRTKKRKAPAEPTPAVAQPPSPWVDNPEDVFNILSLTPQSAENLKQSFRYALKAQNDLFATLMSCLKEVNAHSKHTLETYTEYRRVAILAQEQAKWLKYELDSANEELEIYKKIEVEEQQREIKLGGEKEPPKNMRTPK